MNRELIKKNNKIKCSQRLESLCDIVENDAAVSYILSLDNEIDLETTKMLLLIAQQIKNYYEAQNETISKEQLTQMLQIILTTPKLRAYIVNQYNSQGLRLQGLRSLPPLIQNKNSSRGIESHGTN